MFEIHVHEYAFNLTPDHQAEHTEQLAAAGISVTTWELRPGRNSARILITCDAPTLSDAEHVVRQVLPGASVTAFWA